MAVEVEVQQNYSETESLNKQCGVFRCVKGMCVLQGTIRGQVCRLTIVQNWTVLWELSTEAPGKGGGMLEVLHCSCWMMGIMGAGDAGCSFFVF